MKTPFQKSNTYELLQQYKTSGMPALDNLLYILCVCGNGYVWCQGKLSDQRHTADPPFVQNLNGDLDALITNHGRLQNIDQQENIPCFRQKITRPLYPMGWNAGLHAEIPENVDPYWLATIMMAFKTISTRDISIIGSSLISVDEKEKRQHKQKIIAHRVLDLCCSIASRRQIFTEIQAIFLQIKEDPIFDNTQTS